MKSLEARSLSVRRLVRPLAVLALSLAACADSNAPAPADAGTGLDQTDAKKLLEQVDALAGPLKNAPKSFEVLLALGNLYYDNGRYLDAVDSLRQAIERVAPVEAAGDALRAKGIKASAELPLQCRRTQSYGAENIAEAAKKLEVTAPDQALRCDDEVLAVDLDARSRRGDALYLIGQPDAALAEHKKVLARSPDAPESLFFVGAISLEQSNGDKQKLAEAKKFWERLLVVAPTHPRAPLVRESLPKAEELFAPKTREPAPGELPPNHPPMDGKAAANTGPMAHAGPSPEQIQNVADAVSQTERTPELESGLDALTSQAEEDLDAARYQEARDKLVRVMPMRPNDPRAAADLGAAMAGLGKPEMAERVLGRALTGDPKQPRALFEMGKLLAARGDKAGAKARLTDVQTSDPKFAADHHVDSELAKLR